MKRNSIQQISLAILISNSLVVGGLINAKQPAFAETSTHISQTPNASAEAENQTLNPAPLFRPVLQDIQNQVPSGLKVRLPAFMPNPSGSISRYHPFVQADTNSLSIIFAAGTEFCLESIRANDFVPGVCNMGSINVSSQGSERTSSSHSSDESRAPITLRNNVRGFYTLGNQFISGYRPYVEWEQDGMIYTVVGRSMERQELLDVAISMANQPTLQFDNQDSWILQEQGVLDETSRVLTSDGSRYNSYYFEGSQGQAITIKMISNDFDSYLILLNEHGEKLAENDDMGSNLRDSEIRFTLPYTGSYQILANTYDARGRGRYRVSVEE
jgi:hypothetical protein